MSPALPIHSRAVQLALGQVGQHEIPMGSNTGPQVKRYQAATWLGGSHWPWCAAFCCWCWKQAGHPLPYRGAGAYAWFDFAKKAGWVVPHDKAVPGDFVVWNIGAGHMSILQQKVGSNGLVWTIDGNWSNRVARVQHPLAEARGFIHVPEKPMRTPPKPPLFEVATGADGKKVLLISNAHTIGQRLPTIIKRHGRVTIRRAKKKP